MSVCPPPPHTFWHLATPLIYIYIWKIVYINIKLSFQCLNVSGLFQTVGASETTGLTELQFHQASLVIVYYMINVTQYCGQTIDPSSKSLSFYQEQTRALFGHGGSTTIQEADIGHALGMLNASYTQHADPHAGHQHANHADEVKVVEDSVWNIWQ